MPGLIGENDLSSLLVEIRLHQASFKSNTNSSEAEDAGDFWQTVEASGKVPNLIKVAKAVYILPHGNAEVERVFSEMKNIVT